MTNHNGPYVFGSMGCPTLRTGATLFHGPMWWKTIREGTIEE